MLTYRAACSDRLSPEALERWNEVEGFLKSLGREVLPLALNSSLWANEEWNLVADPTGGNRCVETLPVLVETLPESLSSHASRRAWWSMSDNTLVLNALLDRGVCRVLHGQPLTLSGRDFEAQRKRFVCWESALSRGDAFPEEALPPLVPLRGSWTNPFALVGGNLSALERLGGTPWRPRPRQRVLFLEGLSPTPDRVSHRVAAVVSDPWWEEISGLVLGRFNLADRNAPQWVEDCLSLLPPDLPVARLLLAGHGADAWTIPLGEPLIFPLA